MIFRISQLIAASLFLCSSCEQKVQKDTRLLPFQLYGDFLNVIGSSQNGLEHDKYSYFLKDYEVKHGKYRRAQKLGLWKYKFDEIEFDLDWSIYNSKDERFSFAYPTGWKLDTKKEFDVFFQTDQSNPNLRFVLIENIVGDSINLIDYVSDYLIDLRSNNRIINSQLLKIVHDSVSFFYLKSTVDGGSRQYNFYVLLYKRDGKIYDFTYITDSQFSLSKEVIFFDVVYGFFINGDRILTPYVDYEIEEINITETQAS